MAFGKRHLLFFAALVLIAFPAFGQFVRTDYAFHADSGMYDTKSHSTYDRGNPQCHYDISDEDYQYGIGFEEQSVTKWFGDPTFDYILRGMKLQLDNAMQDCSDPWSCTSCWHCPEYKQLEMTATGYSNKTGGDQLRMGHNTNPYTCQTEPFMELNPVSYSYSPDGHGTWIIDMVNKCTDPFDPPPALVQVAPGAWIFVEPNQMCIQDEHGKLCSADYAYAQGNINFEKHVMGGRTFNTNCRIATLTDSIDEFRFCNQNYSRWFDTGEEKGTLNTNENGVSSEGHYIEQSCDDFDDCTYDYCNVDGSCAHWTIPGCVPGEHAVCNGSNQCVTVPGSGQNECRGDQDCTPNKHNECNANKQCLEVTGPGVDTCFSDSDCQESHLACIGSVCATVPGPGANECNGSQDCVLHHTECDPNKTCITVEGAGNDQCITSGDCWKPNHTECQGSNCQTVSGPGINQCTTSNDCTSEHTECQGQSCVSVPGAGNNQCISNEDCTDDHHLACVGSSCQNVSGPGADQCLTYWDCQTSQHLECHNHACVSVTGPGMDLCRSDLDCAEYHLGCENQQCVSKAGPGPNECYSNEECASPTHLECNPQKQCVSVLGEGINKCEKDADCQKPTHLDCVGTSCSEVEGGGSDLCDSNSDCGWHKKCENYACVQVQGPIQPGEQLCSSNFDCQWHKACNVQNGCELRWGPPGGGEVLCDSNLDCGGPTHLVCNGPNCIKVGGAGTNQCTPEGPNNPTCMGSTHLACVSSNCLRVSGPGADECPQEGQSCGAFHLDCVGADCVRLPGADTNKCSPEGTQNPICLAQTHLKCNYGNGKCERVEGEGTNECNNEGQLDPLCTNPNQHLKCQGTLCVWDPTPGTNECTKPGEEDPVCSGSGSSSGAKLYIDRVEVNPSSSPKGTSVESIIVVVKNVSSDACSNGTISLAFADTAGAPLASVGTPSHVGLLFEPGETKESFFGYPRTDFDTRTLDVGIYSVRGIMTCSSVTGRKKVFFTIHEAGYASIPETNWIGVLAVLLGALFLLWTKPKTGHTAETN